MYKNLDIRRIGISGRQSEVIELALSYRFKGIAVDMAEFREQVSSFGLDHARRLIDSAKIRVATFPLPIAWGEWEEGGATYKHWLDELPKIGELAQGLHCTRCTSVIEPACDTRPYHENFEFHRKRISEVAEILHGYGIHLGLEFRASAAHREGRAFQFVHTFDALALLAKSVASENVGVAIDLWQMHVAGGSWDEAASLPPEMIVAVYLSDIPSDVDLAHTDESTRLMPGETGVIDAPAVVRSLAGLGYDGPITPCVDRRSIEGTSRDGLVRLASERVDQIWKDAGINSRGQLVAKAES